MDGKAIAGILAMALFSGFLLGILVRDAFPNRKRQETPTATEHQPYQRQYDSATRETHRAMQSIADAVVSNPYLFQLIWNVLYQHGLRDERNEHDC